MSSLEFAVYFQDICIGITIRNSETGEYDISIPDLLQDAKDQNIVPDIDVTQLNLKAIGFC